MVMKVPLLDLQAQYSPLKSELEGALLRVAASQHFILGPEVEKLEQSLAAFLGCRHALGVSSGTDALLVALMAMDIHPGDEVIVPTYSFFATAGVVARLNAVPVFVDSDPSSFNIDPAKIEARITSRTKAIIPVHLFGQSAALDAILEIGRRRGLQVVEDAAQAIGTEYTGGRKAGTLGEIGCYSFFPSKNLGCFGDGGLVVTNDDKLGEKLRLLRTHGSQPKYYHKIVGGNFRLDAIQAAVLDVKLPHLSRWSAQRRQNADLYTRLFKEAGLARSEYSQIAGGDSGVVLPSALYRNDGVENYHIYNQYVILVNRREALKRYLTQRGIGTEVYYPVPFHRQECFALLKYRDDEFPVANRAAEHSLALPIYPELTPQQIEYVVASVKDFFALSE